MSSTEVFSAEDPVAQCTISLPLSNFSSAKPASWSMADASDKSVKGFIVKR